jgi:hypothetical protein
VALSTTCLLDTRSYRGGTFIRPGTAIVQNADGDRRDLDMNVESVLTWAREGGRRMANLLGSADTFTRAIPIVSAGTGIHRGDHPESRRVTERAAGPGQSHVSVFQCLPQSVENRAAKLRGFA